MWMVKARQHRPELVQMFEVALSRRMCCSRVDSVSTKPRRPSRIDGLAAEPARHLAHDISGASRTGRHRARRRTARCRSTGPRRRRCRRPSRPAACTSPSDTTSVNTAISSAPCRMRLLGDRLRGRAGCRRSPASARRRRTSLSSIAARRSSAAVDVRRQRDDLVARPCATASRRPRRSADAGRRRARPCGAW